MSDEFKKIESLAAQLKAYANTRIAQAKLSVAEKISKVISTLIAMLLVVLVLFLFIVLLSVAAAIAIGNWLGSMWLGFVIVAVLVMLFGVLLWVSRKRLLQLPIMNQLTAALFENDDDEIHETP